MNGQAGQPFTNALLLLIGAGAVALFINAGLPAWGLVRDTTAAILGVGL
jgi:hypothetical protein